MFFSKIKNLANTIGIEWRNLKFPNKTSVISSFVLVIVFSFICSVIFFVVDFVFSGIIRWILNNG